MKPLWMGVMMVGLVPALLAAGPAPAPCDSWAPCGGGCDCSASHGKSFKEKFLKWLGYRPRNCGSCKWHCDRPTPPLYTFFPPCAEWRQPPHVPCANPCCFHKDVHVGGRWTRARCGGGCQKECQVVRQQAKPASIARPRTRVARAPAPQVTRVFKPVVMPEARPRTRVARAPAPQATRVFKPVVVPEARPVEVRTVSEPQAKPAKKWFPRIRKWFAREEKPAGPRGFRPAPKDPYARPYDRPWLGWLRGEDSLDPAIEASQLHPESYWGSVYRTGHRMFALPTGHGVPGASDY
jgi:hypothetical protein